MKHIKMGEYLLKEYLTLIFLMGICRGLFIFFNRGGAEEIPLKINIPSAGDMKFKIITNYKLSKIENKLAHFDLIQSFTLDSDIKMINMDATGNGDGKAIFDFSENVMKSVITDLKMKMTVEIKENIKMINNSSSHSEILTQKIK